LKNLKVKLYQMINFIIISTENIFQKIFYYKQIFDKYIIIIKFLTQLIFNFNYLKYYHLIKFLLTTDNNEYKLNFIF